MNFTYRVLGTDGGTLHGRDVTGLMRVRVRLNHRDLSGRMTLSFEPPETTMPAAVVPVLRLIAESSPGRFLALAFAGDTAGPMRAPVTPDMIPPGWEASEARFWAEAYDDLARLQSRTSQFFPIPDDFTKQDVRHVQEIQALLDGQQVVLRGKSVSVDMTSAEGLDRLAGIRGQMFRLAAAYESMIFTLGDHQIDLGPCIETYTMDKILNMREARRTLAAQGHAKVVMRLAEHFPAVRYLGTELPT